MSVGSAMERLRRVERSRLANLPTPLVPSPNLAAHLSDRPLDLSIKMDAETGFALGGNKVRKLEFELAPSRLEGVTCLITAGGPQSNHCRVTAAAAALLGRRCVLVLNGPEPRNPTGNALLHRLFGAEIRTVSDRSLREEFMNREAREEADRGGKALVVPIGASTALGSLGYALAMEELLSQLGTGAPGYWIFTSSSSGGTLAGLTLGLSMSGRYDVHVVAVSADTEAGEMKDHALDLARQGAALVGWSGDLPEDRIITTDAFVGEGYGKPTPESSEAIEVFARHQGVVLDPVYTGKAAAGMIHWIRTGMIPDGQKVVFLHTGGHPALLG